MAAAADGELFDVHIRLFYKVAITRILYQIEQSRARGLWKKTKRKLADLIRSASFTEVGVALDYSANWQTRDAPSAAAEPGTIVGLDRQGPIVKCHDTALLLTEVKPEGGSAMDGGAFIRGRPLKPFEDRLLPA